MKTIRNLQLTANFFNGDFLGTDELQYPDRRAE